MSYYESQRRAPRNNIAPLACPFPQAMIGRHSAVRLLPPELINMPDEILADPDRLSGVLLNLYTNAAKFTKQGNILLRVQEVSTH